MLEIACRFSTIISNKRALNKKPTEARETSAPKPSNSDVAIVRTKEKPPDAQSSAQKALCGVLSAHTTNTLNYIKKIAYLNSYVLVRTRTYTVCTYSHIPTSRIGNMHREYICQNLYGSICNFHL